MKLNNAPDVTEDLNCRTAVHCKELLGEQWTEDELWDARHILLAVNEGVPVDLSADEMEKMAKRGLVYDIKRLPGRGRYANRYTFEWHDKLVTLVRAAFCSPNAGDERRNT